MDRKEGGRQGWNGVWGGGTKGSGSTQGRRPRAADVSVHACVFNIECEREAGRVGLAAPLGSSRGGERTEQSRAPSPHITRGLDRQAANNCSSLTGHNNQSVSWLTKKSVIYLDKNTVSHARDSLDIVNIHIVSQQDQSIEWQSFTPLCLLCISLPFPAFPLRLNLP